MRDSLDHENPHLHPPSGREKNIFPLPLGEGEGEGAIADDYGLEI